MTDYIDYEKRLGDIENKIDAIIGGDIQKDNVVLKKTNNRNYIYFSCPIFLYISLILIKPSFCCKNKDDNKKEICHKKCFFCTLILIVILYIIYKTIF
tara:strand:- start:95 stop:388 length:294 start_codon:yes stop_codon:yes gene_type:complete